MEMGKCDIEKLISIKSERLRFDKCQGTSDVWPSFLEVFIDDAFTSVVQCIRCDSLLKWKSQDGTSGLKAHKKCCKKVNSVSSNKINFKMLGK